MIKHIILWKICKDGTEEDKQRVAETMARSYEEMKKTVPELRQDARVARGLPGDYDLCVDALFEDMAALQRFNENPQHLKVRAYINEYAYDKVIFDYEV